MNPNLSMLLGFAGVFLAVNGAAWTWCQYLQWRKK